MGVGAAILEDGEIQPDQCEFIQIIQQRLGFDRTVDPHRLRPGPLQQGFAFGPPVCKRHDHGPDGQRRACLRFADQPPFVLNQPPVFNDAHRRAP